ncbi:MAG: 3-oxoacyl-[acyl-carrier-protein] reductase FabG [Chloroflexota bacterium]|nr:MAG: 3-oxoacyl-[acyl-carrier-protein] reductase FabG [Chloroflexota bacterium]
MTTSLSDKVLFATGAARGLAKAIVVRFLRDGANVLAFDSNAENLTGAVQEWAAGERVISWSGDVRRRADIQAAIEAAVERWGRIDVLANVAGIAREDHFLDIEPEDWQRIIDVNLTGVFNVAQLVARQMARQPGGGVIINMASKNGIAAEVKYAHYNASKAGVILLTKTMALDLADNNIRVNAVAPGYILTPMAAEIDPPDFMEFYQERLIPLNRLGSPEDVAGAFAFLAGDDAKFMTGHTLVIDGGQTCGDGRKLNAYPVAEDR